MEQNYIPPHNYDAEGSVISALLSATNDGVYDSIDGIVKADDFYRDANKIIFTAILAIIHRDIKPDTLLLVEELRKNNQLDAAGGIAYIMELSDRYITESFNVEAHAKVVAEKAQLRRLIEAGKKIVHESYVADKDTEEIINDAEQTILSVTGTTKGETLFSSVGEVVVNNIRHIRELARNKSAVTGITTGFRHLDKITRGLQPSDLILVAARPSMGKTAFTLNLGFNAAHKQNKSVAFFSLEMSKEQLVSRILANAAGVNLGDLQSAQLKEEDWIHLVQGSQTLNDAKIYIDDTPGLTVQQMRSKLRRLKAEKGLDMVIVDYIQLMQGGSGGRRGSENRQQEISEISRNLKLIARELNVPLIALSQLSRSVEARPDKRPLLSDLRESGSLEQDADIVMFLYRDKYYNPDTTEQDLTEVIIRKHRNGELGSVELMFQGEFTRFRDVVKEEYIGGDDSAI